MIIKLINQLTLILLLSQIYDFSQTFVCELLANQLKNFLINYWAEYGLFEFIEELFSRVAITCVEPVLKWTELLNNSYFALLIAHSAKFIILRRLHWIFNSLFANVLTWFNISVFELVPHCNLLASAIYA